MLVRVMKIVRPQRVKNIERGEASARLSSAVRMAVDTNSAIIVTNKSF